MTTKVMDFGDQGFLWIQDDGFLYTWCIAPFIDESTKWTRISHRLYEACLNESKHYKKQNVNVRFVEIE